MGDLLRRALAIAEARHDECADRQVDHVNVHQHQLHEGDIRLLAGLEEVVFAIRQGADDLEHWGRSAELDRVEKVRRLAMLVGAFNQRLSAEVAAAVAALADIKDQQTRGCAHHVACTVGAVDVHRAGTPPLAALPARAGNGKR